VGGPYRKRSIRCNASGRLAMRGLLVRLDAFPSIPMVVEPVTRREGAAAPGTSESGVFLDTLLGFTSLSTVHTILSLKY
jgi:hypothetical protein